MSFVLANSKKYLTTAIKETMTESDFTDNTLTINGEEVNAKNIEITTNNSGQVVINGTSIQTSCNCDGDGDGLKVGTEVPADLKDGEVFGLIVEGEEE